MTSQDDRHRFFGREHLIRAGWVALLALAGFVGAAAYHNFISPQKLIIDDQRQQPIPVIMKETRREPQSPNSKEIQSLTAELKLLRDAYNKQLQETRNVSSAPRLSDRPHADPVLSNTQTAPIVPDVRELTDEVRRLRDALNKEKTSMSASAPRETKVETAYRLPPTVKGYRSVSLQGIVGSTCPPKALKNDEQININFNVMDRSLLTRGTPLFTRIIEKRENQTLFQVFDRVSELRDGHNELSFAVHLDPGSYYIAYGFYLRTELDDEFPKYYSRRCDFEIAKS